MQQAIISHATTFAMGFVIGRYTQIGRKVFGKDDKELDKKITYAEPGTSNAAFPHQEHWFTIARAAYDTAKGVKSEGDQTPRVTTKVASDRA